MTDWKTVRAVGDCVIVKEVTPDVKSEGGILLPESAQEQPPEGDVLCIGPLAWHQPDGRELAAEFVEGARVIFMPHAGSKVTTEDGEIVKVMRVRDIIAVRRK